MLVLDRWLPEMTAMETKDEFRPMNPDDYGSVRQFYLRLAGMIAVLIPKV